MGCASGQMTFCTDLLADDICSPLLSDSPQYRGQLTSDCNDSVNMFQQAGNWIGQFNLKKKKLKKKWRIVPGSCSASSILGMWPQKKKEFGG